jgi:hypothetical protein
LKIKFKSLIIDSIRFSSADWYNVIILGLTLFLMENLDYLHNNPPSINLYDITFLIIIGFLILMEAGYLSRIIHETVKGSIYPPKLNKLIEMFHHGIKDVTVFFIYFSIPLIILIIEAFDFRHYVDAIFINPHILTYYLIDDILFSHIIPHLLSNHVIDIYIVFFSIEIILIIFVYFIFLCALLNMANNNGTIRSGLDIKGLYQILMNVGVLNLVVVFLFLSLVISILGVDFFSSSFEFIPINIYGWNIIDIFIQLLLVPYLLTFTVRLLGLIGRHHL